MRVEAAAALKPAEVRPIGPALPSNVKSIFEAPSAGALRRINRPQLTLISLDQRPAEITEFPQPKPLEAQVNKSPEVDPIEQTKKSENFHPGRKKSYVDAAGRMVIYRRRGRSGCRCDGDERSAGCRSRSCRNKDKQVKPIDIRGARGTKINKTPDHSRRRVVVASRVAAKAA